MGQKHEVIAVRGSSPVEIETIWTHHGPIIAGNPASGYGIALKYTALDGPNKWSECLPRMLRARSVDDMDEAMRSWVDPSNNFMFADTQGDIEYLNRGRLPVRPELNAWLPVPGWSGDYEWNGSVPFDELVRSRNPSAGYIVTANNRIAGDDYPHYIALHYSPDYRARRIKDRLEALDGATVDDMAAVHTEAPLAQPGPRGAAIDDPEVPKGRIDLHSKGVTLGRARSHPHEKRTVIRGQPRDRGVVCPGRNGPPCRVPELGVES